MGYKLIKASAGSGKTYRIAKEYIEYILPDPSRIKSTLAITFTNKAAAEMKERILSFLKGLAGFPPENIKVSDIADLKNKIYIELKENGLEIDITEKSKEALEFILYSNKGGGYSDFSVMTIDSFTNALTKAFSYELDIPAEYAVGMNMQNIIAESVNDLISKADERNEDGRKIADVLVSYITYRLDEEKSLMIEDEIKKVAQSIRSLERNFHNQKIDIPECFENNPVKELEERVRKRKIFESTVKEYCNEIYDEALNVCGGEFSFEFFNYGESGFIGYVKKYIDDDREENLVKFIVSKRFTDALNTIEKIRSPYEKKTNKQEKDEVLEIIRKKAVKLNSYVRNNLQEYFDSGAVLKYICINILYKRIDKFLDNYQKKNEILFIDELNGKIASLFREEDCVPFIYFKMGENFKKYMIDEFQDTSTVQWDNLKPLIENAVAENGEFTGVGDLKQAIYRFRGGSTEVMEEVGKYEDVFEEPLESNWRSAPNIIALNNTLFTGLLSQGKYINCEVYSEKSVKQKHRDLEKPFFTEKKDSGYFEIRIVQKEEGQSRVSLKRNVLQNDMLFSLVEDILKRNYQQSDIGILTRNTNESVLAAEMLAGREAAGQKINVISSDSLYIGENPFVDFVINAVKNCIEPDDPVSLLRMIYLWGEFGDKDRFEKAEKLLGIFIEENHEKYLKSRNKESGKRFTGKFSNEQRKMLLSELWNKNVFNDFESKIRETINEVSVYETIAMTIETLLNRNSVNYSYSIAHLSKLRETAYKVMNDGDARSFIRYYEEYKDSLCIASPTNENAINISTIHKAKGLQFEIAIIPFATWNDKKNVNKSVFMYDEPRMGVGFSSVNPDIIDTYRPYLQEERRKEDERSVFDTINLLYVAMTRAKTELYVFTEESKNSNSDVSSVSRILSDSVQKLEGAQNRTKNGEMIIFSGRKENKEEKEKGCIAEASVREIETAIVSNSHKDKLFIDREMNYLLEREKARAEGENLHRILSFIRMPDDIDDALRKGMKMGIINKKEYGEYRHLLEKLVSHGSYKRFFEKHDELHIEREIVFAEEGKSAEIVRPDRVMINGTDAAILDYKTGKADKNHFDQVKKYSEAYRKMGYNAVGYIAYIAEMVLEEIV